MTNGHRLLLSIGHLLGEFAVRTTLTLRGMMDFSHILATTNCKFVLLVPTGVIAQKTDTTPTSCLQILTSVTFWRPMLLTTMSGQVQSFGEHPQLGLATPTGTHLGLLLQSGSLLLHLLLWWSNLVVVIISATLSLTLTVVST
jgi:hypothetical protein